MIKTTCGEFEEAFRRSLVHEPVPGESQVIPDVEEASEDEEEQRGDDAWRGRRSLHILDTGVDASRHLWYHYHIQ